MFEGKRFLPDTGMPIWKMDRRSTRLAVWLPEPLTVATWMLKSLATVPVFWWAGWPASARASCGLMRWVVLGGATSAPHQGPLISLILRHDHIFFLPWSAERAYARPAGRGRGLDGQDRAMRGRGPAYRP